MRYMGIDYGTKKVGIAFSDENGTMAFPHDVVPSDETLLPLLEALIKEREVGEVVVGHSKSNDGSDNKVQEHINEFIGELTLRVGIPIHLEDEQYSTQEAMRIQGKNSQTDASAAAIILNSFLTKKDGPRAKRAST